MFGRRRSTLNRGLWSVRGYSAAIVVAVVVVFLVVGAVMSWQTLAAGERAARANASHLAGMAADAVAENLAIAETQVAAVAANPGVPQILAERSDCDLLFDLELFPQSHLDLVLPDGRVTCTSLPGDTGGASHAEAPWLELRGTDTGIFRSQPFVDDLTRRNAIAVGMPVVVDNEVVGVVAVLVPTGDIAARLADVLSGPQRHEFALVDRATGSLLSASGVTDDARSTVDISAEPNPLLDDGYLTGSRPVPRSAWDAFVGIRRSTALADARSVVTRGAILGLAVLLVLLASLAVVYRRIARPLRRLASIAGDTGPNTTRELGTISGPIEIVRLAERFRTSVAAHEQYESQLARHTLYDPLTGVANRALLVERLNHSLSQASRSGRVVGVLFLDLDRFKLVNDGLGHAVGDEVLVAIADRLQGALRPGDTLARFGGDEFVIVGDGLTNGTEADRLADRLLSLVTAPIGAGDLIVRITASIGVAVGSDDNSIGTLVRDADTAMHLAKERGGARRERFTPELREKVTSRLTVENEFRVALERDELHLVYQPKFDLATGQAVGVEALLRWDHPALGPVPPVTFIPVAEETGLIVPVGRFVLTEACRQAVAWRRDGIDISMAVNVSGRQLADRGLVDDVATIVAESGMEPERLCLELTESVLMLDNVKAAQTLRALHDLGVKLSIDDFGTGYSSLGYLHRFAVDELKIDRVFVHGLTEHADQRTLVTAMVAMGHALGLQIVAEGVETVAQASELRAMGCETAQGYLYARPQTAASLDGMLAQLAPTRR